MLKIRPHHLLCILGFKGLGYSNEFVENMKKIVNHYFKGTKIKIIFGVDDICEKCPHNISQNCILYKENVIHMDQKVIALLEIEYCKIYLSNELLKRVAKKISIENLKEICKNCPWISLGYCKEGLLNLKSANTL